MPRILLFSFVLILSACAGGNKITDFEKRAVFYTWIDVSEIPGNKMTFFQMRNLTAPQSERFYPMGWEKVGSGFVVWHAGFSPGQYEFDRMQMMSCAGPLCTNTINEFTFGKAGSGVGRAKVAQTGVTFGGCYAFKRTKRGFFRPGEFDTRKATCGASRKQMLSAIYPRAAKTDPLIAQRIRSAM